MARNLIDGVTRLNAMRHQTADQLRVLNAEWERLYSLALSELEEIGKGIDDIAGMLGIIEPQHQMPMLPPRVGTGPQPVFTSQADEFGTGNGEARGGDLDRYQP